MGCCSPPAGTSHADQFTRMLVSVAVDKYREVGLAGTMEYFASPGSALAGLEAAIDYYNAAETVDGRWFAFIGGPDGKIVGHSDITLIGGDVQDLLGGETLPGHRGMASGWSPSRCGYSWRATTATSSAPAGAANSSQRR